MRAEKIDTITIKIPHFLTKEFDAAAALQDRSRSAVMRIALQKYAEELAEERFAVKVVKEYKKDKNKKFFSLEQVMKNSGITKADLDAMEDDFSDCD